MPADDAQVLERLPGRSTPQFRELKRCAPPRSQAPNDPAPATALATAYVRASRAEGDPRFLGHAQAALATWWKNPDAPTAVLMLRATILQSRHEFDAAGADLDRIVQRDPRSAQAMLTRATVLTVRGKYAEARDDCARLSALAPGSTRRSAAPRSTASRATRDPPTRRSRGHSTAPCASTAPGGPGPRRCWAKSRIAAATPPPNDTSAALEANPRPVSAGRVLRLASTSNEPPTRSRSSATKPGSMRCCCGSRWRNVRPGGRKPRRRSRPCARASRRAAPAATQCISARTRGSSSSCAATREALSVLRSTTGKCSASPRISSSWRKQRTPPAMPRPWASSSDGWRDGIRISGGRRPGWRRRGAAK